MPRFALSAATVIIALGLVSCATESSQALQVPQVKTAGQPYNGPRLAVAVGKFDNRTSYARGLFSDGVDRLGSQAKTILITDLQTSNRFTVLDRDNMEETQKEASLAKKTQALIGADIIITGDVTEFGRKETGDHILFGLLGRGKQQMAYAKVALNLVDTRSSQVLFSAQGAGEYQLSNREILGTGGTAAYDSTLNGKVLDLAIREAVTRLVEGIDSGAVNLKTAQ